MTDTSPAIFASVTQRYILALLLVFAATIAYANSFGVPFIFDDVDSIVYNPSIRDVWSLRWLHPVSGETLGGRPLTNFTFAVSFGLSGLSPWGYHLFNLLLHCLSGVVIYAGLSEIFYTERFSRKIRQASVYLAFSCALLWLCLPVSTYTVTYIAQRSEGLMSLFYLLVLYCFWKWQSPQTNRRWPFLCIGFCFCGVLSKEGMATAPVMVLLLDRTFYAGTFIEALRCRKNFYIGLFASWLLLLGLYLTSPARGAGFGMGISAYKYALTESRVVFLYLKLIFFPSPLVFDYAQTVYRPDYLEYPYVIALAFTLIGVFWALRTRPLLGFGLVWFFILLAPNSSIVPAATQPMGENRIYLASLGPIVLVVVGLFRSLRAGSWIAVTVLSCLSIYFTVDRNYVCSSATRIWLDTAGKVPNNPRAWANLAVSLTIEERYDSAERAIDRALSINPGWSLPYMVKGDLLLKIGKKYEAEFWYKTATERTPIKAILWQKFGGLLCERGDLLNATEAFRAAINLRSDDALSYVGLGNVALAKKDLATARAMYEKAIEFSPDLAVAHNDLGFVFLSLGETEKAADEFQTATQLDPTLPRPLSNLGTMFAHIAEYSTAIDYYLKALRITPDDAETRTNMGLAYQLSGKLEVAESCYKEVLRRHPSETRAKVLLDGVTKKLHKTQN